MIIITVGNSKFQSNLHKVELQNFKFLDNILYYENVSRMETDNSSGTEDDDVVADSNIYLTLKISIVYCSCFRVPNVYFNVATSDGQRLSCEECWQTIFKESGDFIGKISLESIPNTNVRMIRIHPCETNSIMTIFHKSENRTKSLLSFLLQPFYNIDPLLKHHFNKI